MDRYSINVESKTVSNQCPQCGGQMQRQGNDLFCPYCGCRITNLAQTININENVSYEPVKPAYDFVMHLTAESIKPTVNNYAIVRLPGGEVVKKGRATATTTTTTLNFSLPTGYYEIRLSRYSRKVYIDEMHTVDFYFIDGIARNHIDIVGETEPGKASAQTYTRGAQPLRAEKPVQSRDQSGVRAQPEQQVQRKSGKGKKITFLVLGLVCVVEAIYCLADGQPLSSILIFVAGAVIFWLLYVRQAAKK